LTAAERYVTIDTMKTITEVLRGAVHATGLPLLQVAEAAGIERASLSRFMAGKRTLRLDMADRLSAYVNMELKPVARKGRVSRGAR
jgi:plasmid maintenance system antidote protein VapI